MKTTRFKIPRDKLMAFAILMPITIVLLLFIMFGCRIVMDASIWVMGMPVILFISFPSFYLQVVIGMLMRQKFPDLNQVWQRICVKLLVHIFIMTPSLLLILFLFHGFKIGDYMIESADVKATYFVGLSINLIMDSIWEANYAVNKYKEIVSEKELLEQMNMQKEFENLKSKLNPHFLFNCFNTLSSLITEDKFQAEQFLNHLSKIYRYLLRNNQEDFMPVEKEIEFINNYYMLLKTRYGNGLELNMQVKEPFYNFVIPTLSMQLLVENAVKHNMVSKQNPLKIDISIKDNKLEVKNNLQLKRTKETSTSIGLKNIITKYKLMNNTDVEILKDDTSFRVLLPLLVQDVV